MSETLGIYIHIPFCVRKCAYCDFYSLQNCDPETISAYINALKIEIRMRLNQPGQANYICRSVYLGGGTPSLLSGSQVTSLVNEIQQNIKLDHRAEITLEANPGTLSRDRLARYRIAGVNRLSLGVQSFVLEKLQFLGRIHTAEQAVLSMESARASGFENVNMDLIYGTPFDSSMSWECEMEQAIALNPEHLSCYMLTLEEGTPLAKIVAQEQIQLGNADVMSDFFRQTSLFLENSGYRHYEISNFSKPGFKSRHNSLYWNMTPYQGFGAAAHSYDGVSRVWNHPDVHGYIRSLQSGRLPAAGSEIPDENQKMMEVVMLGLRTVEGVEIHQLESFFQASFAEKVLPLVQEIQKQGLAKLCNGSLSLTLEGRGRINSILEAFAAKIFDG